MQKSSFIPEPKCFCILHGISPPFCVRFPVLSWAPRASTNCYTVVQLSFNSFFFFFFFSFGLCLLVLSFALYFWWMGSPSLIFIYRVFLLICSLLNSMWTQKAVLAGRAEKSVSRSQMLCRMYSRHLTTLKDVSASIGKVPTAIR